MLNVWPGGTIGICPLRGLLWSVIVFIWFSVHSPLVHQKSLDIFLPLTAPTCNHLIPLTFVSFIIVPPPPHSLMIVSPFIQGHLFCSPVGYLLLSCPSWFLNCSGDDQDPLLKVLFRYLSWVVCNWIFTSLILLPASTRTGKQWGRVRTTVNRSIVVHFLSLENWSMPLWQLWQKQIYCWQWRIQDIFTGVAKMGHKASVGWPWHSEV
jgi:hypothetical protein